MRKRANFLNCLCVLLSKPATAFRTNVLGVSRDANCVRLIIQFRHEPNGLPTYHL